MDPSYFKFVVAEIAPASTYVAILGPRVFSEAGLLGQGLKAGKLALPVLATPLV